MIFKNNKLNFKNKNFISNKFIISNYEILQFVEGWAVIRDLRTNKEGWINKDYTKIINPRFEECWDFEDGFAVFKRNGKEGWIDKTGKVLAEGFDECYFFNKQFGEFNTNNFEGWVDTSGKIYTERPF